MYMKVMGKVPQGTIDPDWLEKGTAFLMQLYFVNDLMVSIGKYVANFVFGP